MIAQDRPRTDHADHGRSKTPAQATTHTDHAEHTPDRPRVPPLLEGGGTVAEGPP